MPSLRPDFIYILGQFEGRRFVRTRDVPLPGSRTVRVYPVEPLKGPVPVDDTDYTIEAPADVFVHELSEVCRADEWQRAPGGACGSRPSAGRPSHRAVAVSASSHGLVGMRRSRCSRQAAHLTLRQSGDRWPGQ